MCAAVVNPIAAAAASPDSHTTARSQILTVYARAGGTEHQPLLKLEKGEEELGIVIRVVSLGKSNQVFEARN